MDIVAQLKNLPGYSVHDAPSPSCCQGECLWSLLGVAMAQSDPMAGEAITLRPSVLFQVAHLRGQGPTLVFIHGALGNRFNWRSQFEAALERGWGALAYDLGGHGQSSAYPAYSVGRHGRDLRRLLESQNIHAPILCCHSYGVPIGLELARHLPLGGLVLVAGGTHDLDPWWEPPLVRWMESIGRHLFKASLAQQIYRRLASGGSGPALDRFFLESPLPTNVDPYRSVGPFWGYNLHRRPHPSRWREPPALVLTGGHDPMFNRAMGEALAGQFTLGQHHHIAEAGHLLMVEEPERVNQLITSWIEALGLETRGTSPA